jgi:hypothetical protein
MHLTGEHTLVNAYANHAKRTSKMLIDEQSKEKCSALHAEGKNVRKEKGEATYMC